MEYKIVMSEESDVTIGKISTTSDRPSLAEQKSRRHRMVVTPAEAVKWKS